MIFVREKTLSSRTLYLGDGINDAPAMMAATAGIALGVNSDITSEAAGAVILQSSLTGVDELMHIGRRMRGIALTSAVGGMGLSLIGMAAAAFGFISPIQGAIAQELIDLLSILNSLRMILPTGSLSDFQVSATVPPRAWGCRSLSEPLALFDICRRGEKLASPGCAVKRTRCEMRYELRLHRFLLSTLIALLAMFVIGLFYLNAQSGGEQLEAVISLGVVIIVASIFAYMGTVKGISPFISVSDIAGVRRDLVLGLLSISLRHLPGDVSG